jgi:hypothetical protein
VSDLAGGGDCSDVLISGPGAGAVQCRASLAGSLRDALSASPPHAARAAKAGALPRTTTSLVVLVRRRFLHGRRPREQDSGRSALHDR